MKRLIGTVLCLALLLAACSNSGDDASHKGKLDVVASFFPVAEAAQIVGGRYVSVRNLTPAGVEPHDIELTPDDVDRMIDADLLLYVGSRFQPAVSDAVKGRKGPSVDVASGLITTKNDPHFWLDPTLLEKSVAAIATALAKKDPRHAAAYRANAARYQRELASLDDDFGHQLGVCERHEIVTGHAAFGYLAARYSLNQIAIGGVSPEAEVDPQRLANLTDLIQRDGVTTVFYEELVPRDFADTLAKEAGVKTAVLNPLEGLTKDQLARRETYVSVMRKNLAALRVALGCT